MGDEPEGRLRADARRNRDRLLAAAKAWFATHGPEAPAEEIARAAGVSPGTLYRHFADREALIQAVTLDNLDNALAETRAALAEESSAWNALVRILNQSQELRLSIRLLMAYPAVGEIVKRERDTAHLRHAMIEVLDEVVRRAQAEGTLRTDVGTGDLAVMFSLLAHPLPIMHTEMARHATARCTALLLESLRAGAGAHLPGHPLTPADIGA
ncbi:TetR/AcrR family transcriptional regulator [Pseudonocardia kunmingensis]|uniref:TetR family transcriptional regulator n=1 Tax=Pseudonocardia kunmingensis TaxID=630975 RepID=A0A543E4H6_9PSEU|nr:TetR/AcrR family transcriptional regulator [Pseudonocardia kunmingensis]TQM16369.1 TetR family transcriptional regulator [Pseudonocardia kunmingensis]